MKNLSSKFWRPVAVCVALTVMGCAKAHQVMEGVAPQSNINPPIVPCGSSYAVGEMTHYDFTGVIVDGEWNGVKPGDSISWSMDMNDQSPEMTGDPQDQTQNVYLEMFNLSVNVSTISFLRGQAEWTVRGGYQGTFMDVPVGSADQTHGADFQIALDGSGDTGNGVENSRNLDTKTFTRKEWFLSVIDQTTDLHGTITSVKKKQDQVASSCPDQLAKL